ncbi:MAG: hypothetical protein JKY15_05095 [Deltaproteobacteria bacterium]|nr:hypothetical protein [Deltaproteobacteria bacterium]
MANNDAYGIPFIVLFKVYLSEAGYSSFRTRSASNISGGQVLSSDSKWQPSNLFVLSDRTKATRELRCQSGISMEEESSLVSLFNRTNQALHSQPQQLADGAGARVGYGASMSVIVSVLAWALASWEQANFNQLPMMEGLSLPWLSFGSMISFAAGFIATLSTYLGLWAPEAKHLHDMATTSNNHLEQAKQNFSQFNAIHMAAENALSATEQELAGTISQHELFQNFTNAYPCLNQSHQLLEAYMGGLCSKNMTLESMQTLMNLRTVHRGDGYYVRREGCFIVQERTASTGTFLEDGGSFASSICKGLHTQFSVTPTAPTYYTRTNCQGCGWCTRYWDSNPHLSVMLEFADLRHEKSRHFDRSQSNISMLQNVNNFVQVFCLETLEDLSQRNLNYFENKTASFAARIAELQGIIQNQTMTLNRTLRVMGESVNHLSKVILVLARDQNSYQDTLKTHIPLMILVSPTAGVIFALAIARIKIYVHS